MVTPLIGQQYGSQKVSKSNLLYNYRNKINDENLKKEQIVSDFQTKKSIGSATLKDITKFKFQNSNQNIINPDTKKIQSKIW